MTSAALRMFANSTRRCAEYLDRIPVAIYRTTLEGKIVYCNHTLAGVFGFNNSNELIGQPVIQFYRNKKDRGTLLQALMRMGRLLDLPVALQKNDGTPIWCAVTAKAVLDEEGVMVNIDGSIRDITGELEVGAGHPAIDASLDAADQIVMYTDLEGKLTDINQAGSRMFERGKNVLIGRRLSGFFPPDERQLLMIFFADLLKTGRNEAVFSIVDGDGNRHHLEWRAVLAKVNRKIQHVKWLARDVTDAFTAQRRRQQDQKLQGVLEMAGGVAHALNQPLTIVNNLLSDISSDLDQESGMRRKVEMVRHQIRKMNDITEKIGNIRKYVAMDYVAGVKIVDIERAAWRQPGRERP